MEERKSSPATGPQENGGQVDDFYQNLQELVVRQARRMINTHLYTKALLSTLPVALLAVDKDGYIQTVNSAAEDILGFTEKELAGNRLSDLFSSNPEVLNRANLAFEEGRPYHMSSESLQLKSGKELVGNLYFYPFNDEEQEVRGLLVSVEDQTYVHFLHDAFKRYVPPSVSELIAQDPQRLRLGGEDKVLSVLFSDLIGFTSIAEKYPPKEMVTLLSDYFSEMTAQVFRYEGTLKEYVGDELMAIFGAPVDQIDHAYRGCATAIAMRDRLSKLRKEWVKTGRPELKARIGLNTGPMVVGNLGSPYRFSYGVLGDHVNLASRLEGLNKVYGTDILLGENTAEQVMDRFHLREIDQVRVKGRKQPVRIFELISDISDPLPENGKAALDLYAEGLYAYRSQKWDDAISAFREVQGIWNNDRPADVMIERCRLCKQSPPGDGWDGVFQQLTK
jgi:PAS domain S-box-containing protein